MTLDIVLKDIPPSRLRAQQLAEQLSDQVLDGNKDPLEAWGELKMLEDAIKKAKDLIRDPAIEELAKYGPSTMMNGVKLTKYNGKRTYKYDHNDDWSELKSKMQDVERKMKIAVNDTIVDEETGEVIPPAKVVYSSETISVELP